MKFVNKKTNTAYIFLGITFALICIILISIFIILNNQKGETKEENEINIENMIDNSTPILDINNPQQ